MKYLRSPVELIRDEIGHAKDSIGYLNGEIDRTAKERAQFQESRDAIVPELRRLFAAYFLLGGEEGSFEVHAINSGGKGLKFTISKEDRP